MNNFQTLKAKIIDLHNKITLLSLKAEKVKGTPHHYIVMEEVNLARRNRDFHTLKWKEYGGSGELTHIKGMYRKPGWLSVQSPFEMYLSCSLEEAQEVFNTQVKANYDFIESSISFNTIKLKTLIT